MADRALHPNLLTGIFLMQTGKVEVNLCIRNEAFRLPYVTDLIARKTSSEERSVLADADIAFHRAEYQRLISELEAAASSSKLPESPKAKPQLPNLLLHLRKRYPDAGQKKANLGS